MSGSVHCFGRANSGGQRPNHLTMTGSGLSCESRVAVRSSWQAIILSGEFMDMVELTAVVGLLVALSVASERLVEIIKGLIPPLNKENPDPDKEGVRRVALQCLAVAAGIVTAFLARPTIPVSLIPANTTDVWPVIALGLLASGGSGFWNSVLTYVMSVKDLKEIDMLSRKLSLQKRRAGEPAPPREAT